MPRMLIDHTIVPPTVSQHITSTLHDVLDAIGCAASGGITSREQAECVASMAAAVESLARAAAQQRDAEPIG